MRKTILSLCLGTLALTGWLSMSADSSYLPVVQKNGKQCYYYSVDKGESIFGIVSRFGWDVDTFMLYNSEAADLKKGQVVYYPCVPVIAPADVKGATTGNSPAASSKSVSAGRLADMLEADKREVSKPRTDANGLSKTEVAIDINTIRPEYYTVVEGDTHMSIARANHTSVAQIFKDNPGLTPDNLVTGVTLKVLPGSDMAKAELRSVVEKVHVKDKKYKIKRDDTWAIIALANNLDTVALKKANPKVTGLTKGLRINIPQFKDSAVMKMMPVLDEREQTPAGVKQLYAESRLSNLASLDSNCNITLLIGTDDASKRREIDFLRGFMLGMDNVVKAPNHVTLRAVELEDSTTMGKLIRTDGLAGTNMLVCATDKDIPLDLVDYCASRGIMLFNVFDAKTDISKLSAYAVQVLPSSEYFYTRTADFLARVMPDRIYIYVGSATSDSESMSMAMLARLKDEPNIRVVSLPDAEALSVYDFQPSLSYAVISDAGTKDDINATLSALEMVVDKYPKMPLTLIGRPNWMVYANTTEKLLRKLDTYIPSRFIFDDSTPQAKKLESDYKEYYKETPVKSLPQYAAMGYDVARYFVSQYLATGGDFNYFVPAEDMIQLEFRPERSDMWNGIVNKCVYLLHFTPFATTDKIRL